MKNIYFFCISVLSFMITNSIVAQQVNLNAANNGTTINSCAVRILDSGGQSNNYGYNENYSITICNPGVGPIRANVVFINTEGGFDGLTFYDGPSTASPVLGTLSGGAAGGGSGNFTATGSCITIRFTSDNLYNYNDPFYYGGYDIIVGCPPVNCGSGNPPANDACASATQICDLNGYCGNTGGWYTRGPESSTLENGVFCGSIENNSWVSFVASATTASFTITSSGCLDPSSGLQAMVLASTNCSTFTGRSNCINQNTGPGTATLNATGLVVGTTYYIIIDGFGGNICNYSVTANSGVQVVNIVSSVAGATCPGQCTNLTVNATGATGYNWSSVPAGGPYPNSQTISVCPTVTTTYTVDVLGVCGAVTSSSFTVNVNTNSTAPTSITATPNPICSGNSTTLTVNGGSLGTGATWNWYTGSCGGTLVGTGSSISVSPSTTTTYFVRAEGTCNTTTCATVTVTVNNSSVAPTGATATPNPICAGSSTTLTVNGGSLGTSANWQWYTGSCGGTSVGSGSTITVSPGTTTTYFVRAEGACNNTTCQSVTVTVNPVVNPAWTNPSPICAAAGTINLNNLITGTTGGTWSGTGVSGSNFNPSSGSQSVTYTVGSAPCVQTQTHTITVIPDVNPAWTNPSPICAAAGNINLDNLVTGTTGGTWSGTGVTGNMFSPSSGTQSVTYTVGTSPCQETQTHTITVIPDVNPAWTNPSPVCAAAGNINLDNLVTGTTGGTWSGTGVTGNMFDPNSGTQMVTYTVGTSPCQETQSHTINVSAFDASWTNPSPICETATPIDLSTLITGSAGGTFSGTGVTGNNFDPSGLGGTSVNITYTVGAAPCTEIQTHTITVIPDVNPAWTNPSPVCAASGNINLDNLVTGTTGGTWSGTGVTGNMFDPNSGTQTVTYTVGTSPCQETQSHTINVSAFDASWTNPGPICEGATSIDLSTLITGSGGGTFSGTGVTGNNFDPSGLGGTSVNITYTVGAAPCTETLTHTVVVDNDDDASFAYTSSTFCEADNNPTPTITGTNGGTFTIAPSGTINPSTGEIDIALTGVGTYTVYYNTTPAGNPCPSVDSVQITIDPQNTINLNPVNPICLNDTLILTANTTGTGTVTWYADPNGSVVLGTGSPFSFVPTTGGTYTIYAANTGACSSNMDSVIVTVNFVDAIINATPVTGSSPLDVFFGNGSNGATNYFWDFGNGSTDTIFEPTHTYTNPGSFITTLIVTDGVCWDTATVVIEVFDESSILIPTVFTPNGDGNNDFFRVDGVNLKYVEGEIYNRWGQKMFSWDNVNGMWDGKTQSGADAADGTYFYIIRAEGLDGKEYFQKGTLTLIR